MVRKELDMKQFAKNFLLCGVLGWCMEILYTSLLSLRRRDSTLKGSTSLWMFPVYGCAAAFAPLCKLLSKCNTLVRGTIYMLLMFAGEYLTGHILEKKRCRPWNYDKSRWHYNHYIRLDFAPHWFLAGLLLERIVCPPNKKRKK
jgi:uncharacterized membrane protein